MTIVKINLHKINAERNPKAKGGQISIKNNVSVKDVTEMPFAVEGKKALQFNFSFVCNYEPNLGKIDVEGQVVYVEDKVKIDEIKKSWDKNKNVDMAVMEQIVNASLHKGNVQAIKISDEVNLPSPFKMPQVRAPENKPEEKAEGVG